MFHEVGVLALYNFFIFVVIAFGVGFWKRDRKCETLLSSRGPQVGVYCVVNGASSLFQWMSMLGGSAATKLLPKKIVPPKPRVNTGINPSGNKSRRRAPIAPPQPGPTQENVDDILGEVLLQTNTGDTFTEPPPPASSPPTPPASCSADTRSEPASPQTQTLAQDS